LVIVEREVYWAAHGYHITYLSCQFWGKASNFRGLFERLSYYVATIPLTYIEIIT
jgi:hypothetical protein